MGLRQNALLLAVLTALIAIVADWTDSSTLAQLWRVPASLLLLGLAYELWWVRRIALTATLSSDARAVLGRSMRMRYQWTHAVRRTVVVEFAPAAPAAASIEATIRTVSLPPNEVTDDEFTITPRQLGTHSWPSIKVRVAGPIGFAWWTQQLHPEFALRVVPDLLRTTEHRVAATAAGQVTRRVAGSGAEIIQLREYRTGDSQRAVDWKATARSGKLISRDFSEDQHLEIIVAIDAGRASRQRCGSLDRLGHYANIAARFAEYAVAHDDRVGIVVFADRPLAVMPPSRGLPAVLRARRVLAAMESAPAESNPLYAAVRIASLVRQRSLVVMLTDLDDATVAGQLAAATRLLLPKHLPLVAGLASHAADRLANAVSHAWIDPYHSLAAQEYSARLRRNVRTLQSLGAPALAVYPEQLERAVFSAYEGFRARRRV